MSAEPDQQRIDTLRFLTVDMVQKADSGHPGICRWVPHRWRMYCGRACSGSIREIRALSAGHGSALLYSLLHLTGYDLSLDDIRQFRLGTERGTAAGVWVHRRQHLHSCQGDDRQASRRTAEVIAQKSAMQ